MGANFFFDKMLPTIQQEDHLAADPKRQLELFTNGGQTFIRVGPINQENSGVCRYTVELMPDDIRALASAFALLSKSYNFS